MNRKKDLVNIIFDKNRRQDLRSKLVQGHSIQD